MQLSGLDGEIEFIHRHSSVKLHDLHRFVFKGHDEKPLTLVFKQHKVLNEVAEVGKFQLLLRLAVRLLLLHLFENFQLLGRYELALCALTQAVGRHSVHLSVG